MAVALALPCEDNSLQEKTRFCGIDFVVTLVLMIKFIVFTVMIISEPIDYTEMIF